MTPELRDKLLHFCNDNEPFLTHNYMRMADTDDGRISRRILDSCGISYRQVIVDVQIGTGGQAQQ